MIYSTRASIRLTRSLVFHQIGSLSSRYLRLSPSLASSLILCRFFSRLDYLWECSTGCSSQRNAQKINFIDLSRQNCVFSLMPSCIRRRSHSLAWCLLPIAGCILCQVAIANMFCFIYVFAAHSLFVRLILIARCPFDCRWLRRCKRTSRSSFAARCSSSSSSAAAENRKNNFAFFFACAKNMFLWIIYVLFFNRPFILLVIMIFLLWICY